MLEAEQLPVVPARVGERRVTDGKGGAARAAYAAAGVDVAAGDRAVELLRGAHRGGGRRGADLLGGLGGFGAALELPAGYARPVLVSATDGVGTKTEIARRMRRLDTIGQDLVAMCVDDLVCHGAQPFFFLDYLAVGRLVPGGRGGARGRHRGRLRRSRAARSWAARPRSTPA